MRLKYVTFTGVDTRTDINRLKSIQEEYPYVEFGVLLSDDWAYNGCRFPDPAICEKLANAGIKNLSAHLCGKLAIDVAYGFTDRVNAASFECFDIFNRCQLNLKAAGMFETLRRMKPFSNIKEIIVQMHTPELCTEFLKEPSPAGWLIFSMRLVVQASIRRLILSPLLVFISAMPEAWGQRT